MLPPTMRLPCKLNCTSLRFGACDATAMPRAVPVARTVASESNKKQEGDWPAHAATSFGVGRL